MQVTFPTSIPTMPKVDHSSIYVGFCALSNSSEYVEALEEKKAKGAVIAMAGYHPVSDTAIAFDPQDFSDNRGLYRGVLVYDEPSYLWAAGREDVGIIAIAEAGSFCRERLLSDVVDSGRFAATKDHWLYGVSNPAELSIYSELFSNFIQSRIKLAVCSTCFLYSIFGVQLSPYTGVLEKLPLQTGASDLGLGEWVDYRMSKEQMRCFHLNVEIVQAFVSGRVAEGYCRRLHQALDKLEVIHEAP